MRALDRRVLVVLLAAVHLYAFPYFGALRLADELPRILTTQELVHRGTFDLGARLGELGSAADIATTPAGRHFQNKAPGISMLAVPIYSPLALAYRLFGHSVPPLRVTTWLLRVALVTLPALLFLGLFRRVADRFAGGDAIGRDGALIAYGLGSLAFPYALVFVSHVPATVIVGAAFALAVRLTRRETSSPRRDALGVGALLGTAILVEYQAVFAAAIIGVFVALRAPSRWRTLGYMVAAAAPPLVALAAYHAACFGSPFRTGYEYSVVENRAGVLGMVVPSTKSALRLFTPAGNSLFVLSPWVLLAVLGPLIIARDPARRARVGAEALVACGIVVVYLVFVASLSPESGRAGWGIGPHYLAVAMPFFGWLAAAGLAACAEDHGLWVPVLVSIFASVAIHVLAGTTYPHWPSKSENPLFEVSLRLLREGYVPYSFGTALGLRGLASLAPVYVAAAALVTGLFRSAGAPRIHIAIAAVLAMAVLWGYRRLGATPEPLRTQLWSYVVATHEPDGGVRPGREDAPRSPASPVGRGRGAGTGATAGAGVLAATPPMGWNGWNKYMGRLNEALVLQSADALVSSGMAAAGYQYVIVDDVWQAPHRDRGGNLVADPTRFPNGIAAVANYVHHKGLKFGIYSDRGTHACSGRPGSFGNEMRDAQTFASWGVDFLKYDNCHPSPWSAGIERDYEVMGNALKATGRPIVYSVSAWWFFGWEPAVGHLWRTTSDIRDNWWSVMAVLDCNGGDTTRYGSCTSCPTAGGDGCVVCNATLPEAAFGAPGLAQFAGPGHWNDPDMLEVGNGGMTDTEYRSHFSLWAIMAAPLIAGNDVTQMTEATLGILTNAEVIAVDQDPLGVQGKPVGTDTALEVWARPLSGTATYAVALLNRTDRPADIHVPWSRLGITSPNATVRDLWRHADLGSVATGYTAAVPPHGVVMLKVAAQPSAR
jgi:alpha-galactosidase